MNKILLMAAAAILSTGGIAVAAAPRPTLAHASSVKAPAIRIPKSGVLYSQTADNSDIGIVSQVFESEFSAYDSQGADDFVVPKGKKWTISEVDVSGAYFNGSGPATSENVYFFEDKKGLPGKLIKEFAAVKGKDDGTGNFSIKIPGMKLKAGTYWLSVNANLAYDSGGEWGWDTTTTAQSGSPAAWENPKNGFATGCTKFAAEDVCVAAGNGPDQIFVLKGKS